MALADEMHKAQAVTNLLSLSLSSEVTAEMTEESGHTKCRADGHHSSPGGCSVGMDKSRRAGERNGDRLSDQHSDLHTFCSQCIHVTRRRGKDVFSYIKGFGLIGSVAMWSKMFCFVPFLCTSF